MSPKFSLIPLTVSLLFSSLPAFAQATDPRAWENQLRSQIYSDVNRGLTTPQQGQFRIDQVYQIQQEHQSYLNTNGTPTGNLLTPQQREQIRQQIAAVDQARKQDIRAYSSHRQFDNHHYDWERHDWGNHYGNANNSSCNTNNSNYNNANYNNSNWNFQQPQHGGWGSWGYKKHHWD